GQAAAVGVRDRLAEHHRREVVAALPAVLLWLVQPEEAELAHAREDPVGERRLLPLVRVWRQLFDGEVGDRLAQRFVLVGEDEVLARALEIRLQHALCGGGHWSRLLVFGGGARGTAPADLDRPAPQKEQAQQIGRAHV